MFASEIFTCHTSSDQVLNVSFTLPDFSIGSEREHPGYARIQFQSAEVENEYNTNDVLPKFARFVNVPEGCVVHAYLESCVYDTLRSSYFYDVEPDVSRSIRTENYLEVGEAGISRDQILAPICINPFLYDPLTGVTRILKSANIRIEFTSFPDGKYFTRTIPKSPSWSGLMKNLILNESLETPRTTTKPGSFVIVYNGQTVLTTLQPLIDWKHRKGYEVHVVKLTDIGTTTIALKNYLQTAYNTWANPPEYILLAGDATGSTSIPTYQYHFSAQPNEFNTVGDIDYTRLSGNDIYPDAYIGRLPFSTITELGTMVNRIIYYEKNINLVAGNWFEKTLLVGDANNSGTSTQTTMYYIKNLITDFNPSQAFSEVYSGNFPTAINSAISSGVSAYYYRGFGDFSGYTNTSFNGQNNNGKYPVVTYITCFGGDYASVNYGSTSQAEMFLRLGTPATPKGAVAVYAPSSETHTCFNNLLTGAFAYGLYKDGDTNPGQAMNRSKLALIANYPFNPQNYVSEYLTANNLLGDPSTELWLRNPQTMNVNFPLSVSPDNGSILITVKTPGNAPIEGAWVCLQKGSDEIFTSGYTDEEGHVVLLYSGATSGVCNITVTKSNYTPVLNTITIGSSHQVAEYSGMVVSTPFEAGTDCSFNIKIKNFSTTALSNATGSLSTDNPYITILSSNATFPTINAGEEASSSVQYSIHIDASCPKGLSIPMVLTVLNGLQTYTSDFNIIENGLNMQIDMFQIGSTNNGINPGETQPLYITIQNLSNWNATQIHTELIAPYTMITFPTGTQNIASIPSGTSFTTETPYQIHVGNEAINGQNVTLNLHLYTDNGWNQYIPFTFVIGTVTQNDPTGPDQYGYYCIESRDTGSAYTPVYQWIELDPGYGGTGTNLNFSDIDSEGSGVYSTISIPFAFRFYGQIYDHITITSNGYLMPGANGSVEWMNWSIPGPMVPKPIIAPFWDDLVTSNGGKVLYQYRQDIHAMVVEWSRMRNSYNTSAVETFEVWLHEAPADSSVSTDNAITFQYNTISNVDAGTYIGEYLNHGEYSTVGIGDNTGEIGLQYSYSNRYPASARTLANLTALRFVSINPVSVNPRPVITAIQVSDPTGNNNNQADCGETILINLSIRNQGQATLSASTISLNTIDQYASVINGTSTLPEIAYYQEAQPIQGLQIHLANNVPNLHTIPCTLEINSNSSTYELQFAIIAHAPNLVVETTIDDGNNGYPEPGETVTMNIQLQNTSTLNLLQATVYPTFPTGWIVTPNNHIVDLSAGSTTNLNYQVQIPPEFPTGSQCNYQLHADATNFNWVSEQNMTIGVPNQMFTDNFDAYPANSAWTYIQDVDIQDAQYIHTTGKEAVFAAGSDGAYILSPVLNGNDLQSLTIKFNYMNLRPNYQYGCLLSRDGSDYEIIWSDTAVVNVPTPKSITISVEPDSWMLYIAIYAPPINQPGMQSLVVDDINVSGIHHAPGYFHGHVTLSGGAGDVTQVSIQAYPDFQTVHPDANGNYILPAYQGMYPGVIATLPGYQWAELDSVSVISGQTTNLGELSLEYYQPITELTHSVSGNILDLQWTLGRDLSKKIVNRDISPNLYRVHIQKNNLNFTDTTTDTHYTHALFGSGNYTIYVVAEFYFQGQLVYSDTSNVITENITSVVDPTIPAVTRLNQNYPNPFISITNIPFDLAKKTTTFSIEIFNIKGEKVKTLASGAKAAGSYSIIWDGSDDSGRKVASGVYFYKMTSEHQKIIKKAIVIH